MTILTEALHTGGFIVSMAPGHRSVENVTIRGATDLLAGTVLGVIGPSTGAPVYAATGGNTGNFTCGTVTEAASAIVGAYNIEFIAATVFNVTDPNGKFVAEGKTGVAFSGGGIGFTLTAGGTAAVAGDSATITVAANANVGQWAALNLSATDGTQIAAGVLWEAAPVSGGNVVRSVVVRDAEVNKAELVWPAGATTNQKNAALAQMAGTNGSYGMVIGR